MNLDREAVDAILEEYGSLTIETAASIYRQRGYVSEEYAASATLRRLEKDIEKYWREDDERGLPRCGRMNEHDADSGKRLYAPPDLWGRADALLNIGERIKQRDANHLKALRLVEWFEDRFGGPCPLRPALERLPDLRYDDEAEAA